jgi:peptide/nickel transport system permease protein
MLAVTVFVALFGDVLAPYSATDVDPRQARLPPVFVEGGSTDHMLGTDRLGRDVLSRLMVGTRTTLQVALVVLAIGAVVGVLLGSLAGYLGGWSDRVVVGLVDIGLGFPAILLALVLAASVGSGFWVVALVIGFIAWPRFARQVRGEVMSLRGHDYVALARVAGASSMYIIVRHIFPNILNTVVVLATLLVGWAIIVEATLGFLGVGIPPPEPTWGNMIADGRTYAAELWWIALFPGLAITVVSLCFNLFGDWLRDILDPTLRNV